MDGVKRHCPDMAPWAYWCLNGSSRVYYNARVINCTWAMPLHPIHARTPRDAVICVGNVNLQQHFVIRQFVQPRPYAQDGRLCQRQFARVARPAACDPPPSGLPWTQDPQENEFLPDFLDGI